MTNAKSNLSRSQCVILDKIVNKAYQLVKWIKEEKWKHNLNR